MIVIVDILRQAATLETLYRFAYQREDYSGSAVYLDALRNLLNKSRTRNHALSLV